ncbi:MAG: ATP-binding cassette domain-containing protein [Eggerthellaceae bacterium]|jgi:peptide/nickel transport system ATP-binding protein|nr:ATP-binding cassette domain-containing protein [Eggerthellaceae bacterium]MDR2716182.1 ATP-binding cassette domain-containing protein [Coriobacteriaceae bacterium]
MLEARNLDFAFPESPLLLSGFSLSVAPGERVALQAPSGFGKTTLCRIVAGYLAPTRGEVLLDGVPLPKRGPCPVQLVWQHPERAVDPRMRMAAVLDEAGAREPETLERLGIRQAWLSRFPHELSGGELQRFCIARALAAGPRYLVADEVSTMLDAVTQARIWNFLLEECGRRRLGLVFVSHSPALTNRIATRTVALG